MRTIARHVLHACGRLLVIAFIAGAAKAQEVSINSWDLVGTTGDQASSASSGINTNFLSASLSRGAGLVAVADADSFNSRGWSTSASYDTANSANDYLAFTITPKASVTYSITKIGFNINAPTTFSPDRFALRASTDNYTSNINYFELATLPASGSITLDLSSVPMLRNLAVPVTFRLIGIRALFDSSTFRLEGSGNDLEVFGTILPTVALVLASTPIAEAGGAPRSAQYCHLFQRTLLM